MDNDVIQDWFKSSLSTGTNNCVEVRIRKSGVDVRNSKNPEAGMTSFTEDEWKAFVGGAQLGEFDI